MDLRLLRYFTAVADELHFGRAAARLHMTQPPLSRAIKQLEIDLGATLLRRSPSGVTLTAAGATLYDEARELLARADQLRHSVAAAAGASVLTIGTIAEDAGARLAAAYRARHPEVRIRIREGDFADPTAGLRAGLVDVALTRTPFDGAGLGTRVLRTEPVGAVLRAEDPLAGRASLHLSDLLDRQWFQLPADADPVWRRYWSHPTDPDTGPVVRTATECRQTVLWNGTVGLTPLGHPVPAGLAVVPLVDKAPNSLVLAWRGGPPSPLVRSFVELAATVSWDDDAPADGRSPDRNRAVTAGLIGCRPDLAD
ncbi:LysR family transcriptional regulator [Nocardia neocaledoniensis]|uniref:LysR family transcriptional regulator n=1 Tax=Nocardia neocaledoniensis TaxID=236511 RepID=UPI0024555AC5|nr:LysR substrate-binding domain-containing protein [Nocardia neocaledoniensis]